MKPETFFIQSMSAPAQNVLPAPESSIDAGRRVARQLAHRTLQEGHELAVEGVPAGRTVQDEARDPRIGRALEKDAGLGHRITSIDPGRSRGTVRI